MLRALLENPETVVTREELRRRLWADDTLVDFESGLNNRLRLTLGDSADSPRYIETLARTGYRFIAPVEEVSWPNTVAAAPPPAISHPASNVVRAIDGVNQLEFPIGKALYRTSGWLGNIRVSPRDNAIAFLEHPVRHDDSGSVKLLRANGQVQTLSPGWASAGGLAWHPSAKEIWFTAAREGLLKSLWAVSMSGKLRAEAQAPGILTLQDLSPEGKALVTRETRRLEMAGLIHVAKDSAC